MGSIAHTRRGSRDGRRGLTTSSPWLAGSQSRMTSWAGPGSSIGHEQASSFTAPRATGRLVARRLAEAGVDVVRRSRPEGVHGSPTARRTAFDLGTRFWGPWPASAWSCTPRDLSGTTAARAGRLPSGDYLDLAAVAGFRGRHGHDGGAAARVMMPGVGRPSSPRCWRWPGSAAGRGDARLGVSRPR